MYDQCRSGKQLLRQTYVRGRTQTVTTSWSSSASYWRLILFELVSCSLHKRGFACVLPSDGIRLFLIIFMRRIGRLWRPTSISRWMVYIMRATNWCLPSGRVTVPYQNLCPQSLLCCVGVWPSIFGPNFGTRRPRLAKSNTHFILCTATALCTQGCT